jgi:alpha-methylacyl-CoA racemase
MLLADLGADILRIDRMSDPGLGTASTIRPEQNLLNRGRRSVAMDMKNPDAVETVLRLVGEADALIEGFRPGVMERLGLGPDVCLARNPKLVFGRMTGWGQSGTLSNAAGHDINYIALSGALHAMGRRGEKPVPPLNLVGDFGGGALYLAMGVLAALIEARTSGEGQVVDAAMTDGAASLMTMFYSLYGAGVWKNERGANMLDTGAHFYDVYETKDGKYVAIGSIEKKFYKILIDTLDLDEAALPGQHDRAAWPELKERFEHIFRQKTRDEWCELLEGTDACFAPVLDLEEAPGHPHNQSRRSFVEVDGILQPAPAPRFSRTDGTIQRRPPRPGEHTDTALVDWGLNESEIAELKAKGAIA